MSVSLRSTLMHVLHVRPEKMIRNASPGTNFILRRMVDSRVPHRLDHLDATDIDFFVPETTGVLEGSEIKISECDEILERMGNIDFAVVDRQRADRIVTGTLERIGEPDAVGNEGHHGAD